MEAFNEEITKLGKYLIYFSCYMCTMLFIIGLYCILKDLIVIALLCVVYLFGHLVYSKGVQQKWVPVLRLYQIFYAIFSMIVTISIILQLVDLFNGKKLNYMWFFSWLLLVLPTLPTIYMIQKYINLISKASETTVNPA